MIKPVLQDEALLADIKSPPGHAGAVRVWWLGQSGFLVQWPGGHLLLDPYLSDSLTVKYADTDKPHVRMTEQVIDPFRLDFIGVATSSHNHTDHLDAHTLIPLLKVNANLRIIVPEANRTFAAARLGVEPATLIGMADGVKRNVAGLTIHGIPAAHDTLEQDERGLHRFMGYVIELPLGDSKTFTIYHSGDTLLYDGMTERLRQFKIDLALLPINGRAERKVAGNLWGREAVQLAKAIDAGMVIPCHYEMFEFNTASPQEFVAECEQIGQPYCVLEAGGRMEW